MGGRQAIAGAVATDTVQSIQEGGWRLQDADDLLFRPAGILSAAGRRGRQVTDTAEVMSMHLRGINLQYKRIKAFGMKPTMAFDADTLREAQRGQLRA